MDQRGLQVTVGIPVFNEERYLAQTIECMLDQTFQDFEIVLSDNSFDGPHP